MALQMQHGQMPFAEAPYNFRIGTPFLASLLPGDLLGSFRIVNIIANLLSVLLLMLWLRLYLSDWKIRVLLCVLFITQWHAPVRYVYFNPSYTDPWLFVVLLTGLIMIHHVQQKLTGGRVFALTALS